MDIRERIKHFRKKVKKLTQDDFAKKINMSRSNLAGIESGGVNITDRVLSDICREFNVSDTWIRTGEGSMYAENESSVLAQAAAALGLDEEEKKFLAAYLKLQPEMRENVKATCRQLTKLYGAQDEISATLAVRPARSDE